MYLVPRSILFKVLKNKRPVKLLEDDTGTYEYFVNKSTEIFKNINVASLSEKMKEFDNQITEFMKQNLEMVQYVGQGSSRKAFIMVDGRCLKVAFNPAGLAQNKREINVCLNDMMKYSIFPEFYGADQTNWLSLNCELCSTAVQKDFVKLFGAPVSQVMDVVVFMVENNIPSNEAIRALDHFKKRYDSLKVNTARKLAESNDEASCALRSLVDFYLENGGFDSLLPGDLESVENWGLTLRNDHPVLVVIDAGFDANVYKNHYC